MTRKPKCYTCNEKPTKEEYAFFCTKHCASRYGIFMANESGIDIDEDGEWSLPTFCTACDNLNDECVCLEDED